MKKTVLSLITLSVMAIAPSAFATPDDQQTKLTEEQGSTLAEIAKTNTTDGNREILRRFERITEKSHFSKRALTREEILASLPEDFRRKLETQLSNREKTKAAFQCLKGIEKAMHITTYEGFNYEDPADKPVFDEEDETYTFFNNSFGGYDSYGHPFGTPGRIDSYGALGNLNGSGLSGYQGTQGLKYGPDHFGGIGFYAYGFQGLNNQFGNAQISYTLNADGKLTYFDYQGRVFQSKRPLQGEMELDDFNLARIVRQGVLSLERAIANASLRLAEAKVSDEAKSKIVTELHIAAKKCDPDRADRLAALMTQTKTKDENVTLEFRAQYGALRNLANRYSDVLVNETRAQTVAGDSVE